MFGWLKKKEPIKLEEKVLIEGISEEEKAEVIKSFPDAIKRKIIRRLVAKAPNQVKIRRLFYVDKMQLVTDGEQLFEEAKLLSLEAEEPNLDGTVLICNTIINNDNVCQAKYIHAVQCYDKTYEFIDDNIQEKNGFCIAYLDDQFIF